MKLRTKIETLLKAVALVEPTLDNKGSASNLYLNAVESSGFLYLYSTDSTCETVTKIKVEIEVPGDILVNPSKLAKGLQGIPSKTEVALELSPNNNALYVSAGNVKFSLATSTGAKEMGDRMKLIPLKADPTIVIPTEELSEFIKRTHFCIVDDLTGQRADFSVLKIVDTEQGEEAYATDGYIAARISSDKKQIKGSFGTAGLLIPAPVLPALGSLLSSRPKETVSIIYTESKNKVYFKFADSTCLGALLKAANYPNLKPTMEQEASFIFDIPREVLKQSLVRANSFVYSTASKRILEMELDKENVTILAKGEDKLSDKVPITYKGDAPVEPIRIGVNIVHLVSIVSNSQSENLTFGFTNGTKPLIAMDTQGDDEEKIDIKYVAVGVKLAG